jgi:hypothetical protein
VQFSDYSRHRNRRDGFGLGEVREAELIGEHDCVDATFLEAVEFPFRTLDDVLYTADGVETWVPRKCHEMQHGDDGFIDTEGF